MAKKPTYEKLEQRVKKLEKEAVKYIQIKQKLTNTTELLEHMLDVSPAVLYRCEPSGHYPATFISRNIKQQLGYEPEDFTDDPQFWVSHIHPDDAELIISRLQSLFKKGYHRHEYRFLHKNGEYRWMYDDCRLLCDAEGKPIDIIGNWIDITEHKKAEEALRKSEEKFRGIFNDALDMIHIVDANGNMIGVNQAELETMAYTRDEYIGKHILEIVHPDYQTVSKTALNTALEGKEVKGLETAWITKHGKRIDVEVNAVPLTDMGKIVSVRTIARDITERKQVEEEKKELEAKFQEAQKMEAIGTLAGGIAHDFNNLLMAIQGNISLMLLNIDSTHPHYKFLTTIKNEITNGAELTKQLLGYARKGRYYVQLININELVEKTAVSVGIAKREISIHRELAVDLFAIEADQGQIQQSLLNLLVNAADAMPGGGDLILKTANVTDKDIKGKVYDPKPGNYVLLTVTDTGTGMDKETIKRIFDPFFTTKEMGRGTGLGLASTYGIIKGHGGYIDVDSEPDRGTTFAIYLPATEKKVEKAAEPAEQMVKGTGTILLVDDEERVLDIGIMMLKGLGYTVLWARDGREAVEIYEKNKDKIDLVILDMVMPRMGGGKAYDKMKEIHPEVKVLLSSGYSVDSEAKEILARGCDAFIQKPFGMQELSQRITGILEKGV